MSELKHGMNCHALSFGAYESDCNCALVQRIKIAELEQKLADREYVNVEDRLPPHHDEVEIAIWDGCEVTRAFAAHNCGEWWAGGQQLIEECGDYTVIAWKECSSALPPKPTGEEFDITDCCTQIEEKR